MLSEIKKRLNESKLLLESKKGNFNKVKDLIENNEVNLNVQSFFTGRTPIIFSAMGSHEKIVEYLISKKADLEKNDYFDEKLIHHALKSKLSSTICNDILEKSSLLTYTDESGKTLLHLSVIYKRKSVFYFLMDKKVPIDTYDNEGVSPLMNACENGDYDIVKFLLEHGAKINRMDRKQTPRTVTDYASKHIDILNLISKYRNN